jgi:hypothetical protein
MGRGAHSKVRVKNDRVKAKKARDKRKAVEAGEARTGEQK